MNSYSEKDNDLEWKDIAFYQMVNCKLHDELNKWKNNITLSGDWNKSKKLTNVYEQILTKNLKKPISRSYYKLWEIAHDFCLLQYQSPSDRTLSVHLAEGPGGFIESLCDIYLKQNYVSRNHLIHGITLLSSSSSIPNWNIPPNLLKTFRIHLHDSTNGDLYNVSTIDAFIAELDEQKADLITADGGFDFSQDFNSQELQFRFLMLSQIYCAIRVQKRNGSFLLKVFDLFCTESIALLAICSRFFESFTVLKPKTSRPANSEKYILFTGFQTTQSQNAAEDDHNVVAEKEWSSLTSMLRNAVIQQDLECLEPVLRTSYFKRVYKTITLYNIVYTVKQISCLKETITLNDGNSDKNELLRNNFLECKKWREEYSLT